MRWIIAFLIIAQSAIAFWPFAEKSKGAGMNYHVWHMPSGPTGTKTPTVTLTPTFTMTVTPGY